MSKICGIYKITSPSGKIYIGQSINIEQRMVSYRCFKQRDQTKIFHSIRKYGFENHNVEVLHTCPPEELDDWERWFIDVYDSFNTDHGMNLTQGGCNYRGIVADSTKNK